MSEAFSTGSVATVILVSFVLTIPVSLALVVAYQRQIAAAMRRKAGVGAQKALTRQPIPMATASKLCWREVEPGAEKPSRREVTLLLERAMRGPTRALAVYGTAAFVYALVNALVWLTATGNGVTPSRLIAATLTFGWPMVLTANLPTYASPATQARNVAVSPCRSYWSAASICRRQITLWVITAGPPTVILMALMYPKVRTAGPLVFAFTVTGVQGANIFLEPFASTPVQQLAARASAGTGLSVITWVVLAALIGFVVAGVAGWAAIRWVRDRYDAKLISDQSLPIDAIWLVFTIYNSLDIASNGVGWVLLGARTVRHLPAARKCRIPLVARRLHYPTAASLATAPRFRADGPCHATHDSHRGAMEIYRSRQVLRRLATPTRFGRWLLAVTAT